MSSRLRVEPALLVLEHAQAGDAAREAVRRRGGVGPGHAEQDAEARFDLADDVAADDDPGPGDSLHDGSHPCEPIGYLGFVAGVSRPLALIGALAAAGLLGATATAAPGDPKVSVKPADQAYARTIVLRKADVPGPGWTGKATEFGGLNPDCVVKHYSLSKLTATAQVGTTYTRPVDPGTFLVESDVDVFATPAQARQPRASRRRSASPAASARRSSPRCRPARSRPPKSMP